MDVTEHLKAHLAKDEDLIRRREVRSPPADLQKAMSGNNDVNGKHILSSAEDSVLARLLDSLRPSEPDLIEHLDRLILFLGESKWMFKALIEAIRSCEIKMNSAPASSSSAHGAALIRHYHAKTETLSARASIPLHIIVTPGRSPSRTIQHQNVIVLRTYLNTSSSRNFFDA